MQSTDCRRAFPCWDEPDFKAVFGITLVVRDCDTAVSNSPEVEREPRADGLVTITFADTMIMSTYLVAFVVGPLEATEWRDVDGIPLRLVHIPGKGHLTEFGLDVAEFCLKWFQDYYGIPYPGDKVELLALPDFAAGAMENLGCITFRENLLLVDPVNATQPERQLVADVVAHELAHMWFGDLVTMRWWNGIWLNEAFATFMEIAACGAFKPEWGRWLTFGIERTVAFETDSLASTRPVEFEVNSPPTPKECLMSSRTRKVGLCFACWSNTSARSNFEMVCATICKHTPTEIPKPLTFGMRSSRPRSAGSNTMDSWIWQAGYPVISVTLDGDELVMRQRKFSFADSSDDTTWMVPLSYRTASGTSSLLLSEDEQRVQVDTNGPVIVNAGGHAFEGRIRQRITVAHHSQGLANTRCARALHVG